MFWRIRRLGRGIRNLFWWFLVVWKDEQWDDYFLYRVLEKKLQLMENYFNSDKAITVSAKKDAKRIRVCRILCKRLCEDNYSTPWDRIKEQAFDRISHDLRRINDFTEDEEFYLNLCWIHEENMRVQDKRLLFDYMRRYIDGWWE